MARISLDIRGGEEFTNGYSLTLDGNGNKRLQPFVYGQTGRSPQITRSDIILDLLETLDEEENINQMFRHLIVLFYQWVKTADDKELFNSSIVWEITDVENRISDLEYKYVDEFE